MLNIELIGMDSKMKSIPLDRLSDYILMLSERISIIETALKSNVSTPVIDDKSPCGISEASTILRLSKSRIYVLSSQGKIPSHKRGGRLHFFKDELFQFIRSEGSFTNKKMEAL